MVFCRRRLAWKIINRRLRLADRVLQAHHLHLQVEEFLIIFKRKKHGVDRLGSSVAKFLPRNMTVLRRSLCIFRMGAFIGIPTGFSLLISYKTARQPALSLQVKVRQTAVTKLTEAQTRNRSGTRRSAD